MAKQCIGLDIGSSAASRPSSCKKKGSGWALQAFGMQPLVPQTIVDGTIMDQGAVADAIRQLWSRLKLKQKDVAIAIAGHSVIIKKITVPQMKPEELARTFATRPSITSRSAATTSRSTITSRIR